MSEVNKPVVLPSAPASTAVTMENVNKLVEEILAKKRSAAAVEQAEAMAPKPLDWSKITEKDIGSMHVSIPAYEHEIPDFMDIKLKDDEYVAVWANKDSRRVGQLKAEGYEYLKAEHIHPAFKLPLSFDSEGLYIYFDVVAFRVHKRIRYGKLQKALELSQNQLRNRNRPPRTKVKGEFRLTDELILENNQEYYDTSIV